MVLMKIKILCCRHAKMFVCRSNCSQYKDKNMKIAKNENFEKRKKKSIFHSTKNIFLKILGCWVENCDL